MILFVIPNHQKVQHWLGLVIVTVVTCLASLKDLLFGLTSLILRRGSVLGRENVFPGLNGILFARILSILSDFRLDFSFGDLNFPYWFLLFHFDLD